MACVPGGLSAIRNFAISSPDLSPIEQASRIGAVNPVTQPVAVDLKFVYPRDRIHAYIYEKHANATPGVNSLMTFLATRVRRPALAILIFLASTGFTKEAMASGDIGCSTIWRLVQRSYEGCSNMAFLSPSNDTRVNLLLMMADLRSAKPNAVLETRTTARPDTPLFLWESLADRLGLQADKARLRNSDPGAQIDSTTSSATLSLDDPFTLAVRADNALKAEEREALLGARQSDRGADTASTERVTKTASAKAYSQYLKGAAEFRRSDYENAAGTFASLTNAQPAWVRETAEYMVGRTLINRAQVGAFDEYGSFSKNWHADAGTITAAEAALDKYLQQYPKGVYAHSAQGLKRRGFWLARDTDKLEEEYGELMMLSPEERNVTDVELAQEIDNKIVSPPDAYGALRDAASEDALLKGAQNPLLLAMLDLQAMRSSTISLSALQQQKPYFASQMALYEYLLAVHTFYIENKPLDVLRMIPDGARQSSFSYLQFSRQVLRGMALEALKDHNALGFWMQMLAGAKAPYQRSALELAIAYHEERAGELRNVFALASPVHYPYLREVLLVKVANADLLRTQAQNPNAPQRERDIALFTLLYKEATRSDAADFLKDVALIPSNAPTDGYFLLDNPVYSNFSTGEYQVPAIPLGIFLHDKTDAHFGCPGLRGSEELLAQDANNPTARLCVADFVRLNPSIRYLETPTSAADELGDTPSLFPGGDLVRMDTYTSVLANPKSSRNDKAYALFRSVNCYAPSGNNGCGGKDVPMRQRKAWFTSLKHDYADTRWANALHYYW